MATSARTGRHRSTRPPAPLPDVGTAPVLAVLVCHDGERWLPQTLDALRAVTPRPRYVLAVDTGSTDRTPELLTAALAELSRTYSIAAGGSRALSYRLTIKLAAGGLVEGSWRQATDDRIVVDRRLVDERQVQLRAIGGPMSALKLVEVAVALEARDPVTQAVRASTKLRVLPGQETGFAAAFSYLRGDPPILQVFHQVTAIDSSGFVRTQPWTASSADLLVLDLRTQTITG